jgi:hypothetical protein
MSRYRDQDFIAELSTDQVDNTSKQKQKNQMTQWLWCNADFLGSLKNWRPYCLAITTDNC